MSSNARRLATRDEASVIAAFDLGDDDGVGNGNAEVLAGDEGESSRKVVGAGDLFFTRKNVDVWVTITSRKLCQGIPTGDALGDHHDGGEGRGDVFLLDGVDQREGEGEKEEQKDGGGGGGQQDIFQAIERAMPDSRNGILGRMLQRQVLQN